MTRQPSPADIAAATAFIDGEYQGQVSPGYFQFHRSSLIRKMAKAEMHKREAAEFRAAVEASRAHDQACLAAVEALPSLRAAA